MKLLKRITAVMAALLIAVNITVINIFAVVSAPVVAVEIEEILIALLFGAGHSQSELNGMDVTQMQSLVIDDLNSGLINKGTILIDPVTQLEMTAIDFLTRPDVQAVSKSVQTISSQVINDFVGSVVSSVDGEVKLNDDYFMATSTMDMEGYGACVVMNDGSAHPMRIYCKYVMLGSNGSDDIYSRVYYSGPYIYYSYNNKTKQYEAGVLRNTSFAMTGNSNAVNFDYYGDIRYFDGTPAPTDDEFEYQLGEVDGTKVTPDMLNPDGTVTIDGVTYYPADYLDPDKLTDTGKDALLAALLSALANKYVKSEDKPIVDVDDIPIEVAEEFQDYAVPVGIANVFPFCIPWDIVRGFQLLNRPAVTPKFKIPFNIPEFGLFPGVKKSITLDFSEYDTYIQIFRWFQLLGFVFLLCKLSMTHVKGAGA